MSNTLNGLTLYHFPSCPFCRRVSAFIKQNGIKISDKNIMQNSSDRQALIKGGGSAQVPCLRIEDKTGVRWMYESMDIIRYLEQQSKES